MEEVGQMKTVTVDLPEPTWKSARALAEKRGMSLPELLRALLQAELEAGD